jgi:hypothetical protein
MHVNDKSVAPTPSIVNRPTLAVAGLLDASVAIVVFLLSSTILLPCILNSPMNGYMINMIDCE